MFERKKELAISLSLAARDGDISKVEALLAQGAQPNQRDEFGQTALIMASFNGHNEIVGLLLEHGANPNLKSKGMCKFTPMQVAIARKHMDTAAILLSAGAKKI